MDPNNNPNPTPPNPQPDVPPAPGAQEPQQYQPAAQNEMPNGQPGSWQGPTGGEQPGVVPPVQPTPPQKKFPLKVALLAVAGVLILAAVAYFVFARDNAASNVNDTAKKSSESAASQATDLATMDTVALMPPASISGFKEQDTGIATAKRFVADDGKCEFVVGTIAADQLPGDSLEAMVAPQLQQLRDAGATIVGPDAGSALILKADSGSTKYRMPTLNFEFSQETKRATVHYSAVILKSTDRAVVNRTCLSEEGKDESARMKLLDEAAKKVIVSIEKQQ